MAYNIQMNYYDGSSYQELYPRTLLSNVSDWRNSIYNKTEVDSIKSTLQNNINNVKKFNFETSFTITSSTNGNVRFTDYIYNYNKIIIDFSDVAFDEGDFHVNFFESEEYLINTGGFAIYEIMNCSSSSTKYIYYSYKNVNQPRFYRFVVCPLIKYMKYNIRGGYINGTINVYAS